MKLFVRYGGRAGAVDAPEGRPLSESLGEAGIRLDLRCGGNNRCGRCRVTLLSGRFLIAGEAYDADAQGPRAVNSCAAFPAGGAGEVSVPESSLLRTDEHVETGCRIVPALAGALPGPAVAFDIGTTTVAAALVEDGVIRAAAGVPNPQGRFGDNVIDRIVAAGRSPGALGELRRVLVEEALNPLLLRLTASPDSVCRVAVAANTVMSHIFCGVSPASIGEAPFRPRLLRFPVRAAGSYGLAVNPGAPVMLWPALSGSVGGDITGGIAVTGFGRDPGRNELLLDIGTNCEMVLSCGGRRYASAAAAGPAFEGTSSAVGCRARPGAIDHLTISESGYFRFHVIGGDLRRLDGICGTGLVDFLASARAAGLLDGHGRFDRGRLERLGRLLPGTPESGCRCMLSSRLSIAESDVESLLKAKAAIGGGVLALLDYAGIRAEELDVLWLCGGFAAALDPGPAKRAGLIPPLPEERIRVCGNTSLAAAILAAEKPDELDNFESERANYTDVNLNDLSSFPDFFAGSMTL
ncbi:MAG: DUF4445 domain-containing protein [Lentisphaeria bacterium]|nr:DUF4445 domain-containing protein [Lentisphaeria bacterium]